MHPKIRFFDAVVKDGQHEELYWLLYNFHGYSMGQIYILLLIRQVDNEALAPLPRLIVPQLSIGSFQDF
ncbi:hypothetical protein SDC9_150872 [bioreactor metagenome]|uniref:Uncharacterized protein n=1 Tax=bioreactor metagenome TaxID=1076179 RepID=A0A645ENQ8_9ZZZZ